MVWFKFLTKIMGIIKLNDNPKKIETNEQDRDKFERSLND